MQARDFCTRTLGRVCRESRVLGRTKFPGTTPLYPLTLHHYRTIVPLFWGYCRTATGPPQPRVESPKRVGPTRGGRRGQRRSIAHRFQLGKFREAALGVPLRSTSVRLAKCSLKERKLTSWLTFHNAWSETWFCWPNPAKRTGYRGDISERWKFRLRLRCRS